MVIVEFLKQAIPIISFGVLVLSLMLFAWDRANINALREAAKTWRELADARELRLNYCEEECAAVLSANDALVTELSQRKAACGMMVDALLDGVRRMKTAEELKQSLLDAKGGDVCG